MKFLKLDTIREIVVEVAERSIKIKRKLGWHGRLVRAAEDYKGVCLLEKRIYEETCRILDRSVDSYLLRAEDFRDYSHKNSNILFHLDPVDGSAYYVRQKSKSPYPITTVISAIHCDHNESMTYNSVLAAAIADLNSREIWYADADKSTRSSLTGLCLVGSDSDYVCDHPIWQADFYFTENAEMRMILKHPRNPELNSFEFLNPGSVAWQAAKVACGEADTFINLIGPKAYELTAMYLIVKKAGGYTLNFKNGSELGESKIEFNERVPIIMARSEGLAKKIYNDLKIKD